MNVTPPDLVCRFCENWCGGTCEGALDSREHDQADARTKIREALAAASTALQERGEFHIYADGKVYTRAQCIAMARLLDELAAAKYQDSLP